MGLEITVSTVKLRVVELKLLLPAASTATAVIG